MSDLLIGVYCARQPGPEGDRARAALERWFAFRDARNQVLGAELADAFCASLVRELGTSAAAAVYAEVAEFHEWLLATGVNSANPFTPYRTGQRRPQRIRP